MLNLNYILFFFFRFYFLNYNIFNAQQFSIILHKHYKYYNVYKISRKKEILCNYKMFWFKFISYNTQLQYASNYFTYLYFFMQSFKFFKNQNLFNFNTNFFNMDNNVIFLNFRFKWIYKLRLTLKYIKKYFFFLKNLHRLKHFILRNKNVSSNLLINSSSYNILNLCLSYGFCYNFSSLLNLINLKIIWLNNIPIANPYLFIKQNDLIQFYVNSINSKFLFNMIYYNHQIITSNVYHTLDIFKKCNFFFSNNSINLKINTQHNYFNMSFVRIKLKTSFYVNNCVNSFFNLSNIRLYNWLIVN